MSRYIRFSEEYYGSEGVQQQSYALMYRLYTTIIELGRRGPAQRGDWKRSARGDLRRSVEGRSVTGDTPPAMALSSSGVRCGRSHGARLQQHVRATRR
jgi:hypothetical protein